jgi:predicted sulfurtransferase
LDDQRFLTLSCKVTKEVVSLDLAPTERELMIAAGPGEHLSPQQFHDTIANAVARKDKAECIDDTTCGENGPERGELVLIDVRNIYETEIGKFECPAGIPVLDPKTRKVTRIFSKIYVSLLIMYVIFLV